MGIAGCNKPKTSGLDGLDRLDIMQTIVQEYLRPAKECMVGQLGNGTELESAYINKYS